MHSIGQISATFSGALRPVNCTYHPLHCHTTQLEAIQHPVCMTTNHCGRGTDSLVCCIRCSSSSSSRQTAEILAAVLAQYHHLSHACDSLICCRSRHDSIRPSQTVAIPSETIPDKSTLHYNITTVYGSLEYVRDNPGEPVPEGTFRHLLDFLVQNEDNTGRCTNNPDGLPPHPD